jgi:hypothetical protein
VSEITIEVVEDIDHPQGGHAVIRLNGLWLLPANATYRLEPIDAAEEGTPPHDWPSGDRVPLSTRLTPLGVEIVVGPDVVDAPALLPGTPVAVSVPAAFVRAEVLWPDLPVSAAPSSPPVVLTAAELAAELEAVAEATRRRQEADALAEMKRQMNGMAAASTQNGAAVRELSELRPRPGAQADLAVAVTAEPAIPMPAVVPPPATTAVDIDRARPRALVPLETAGAKSQPRRKLSIGAPFALGFAIAAGLTALVTLRQGGAGVPPGAADAMAPASFSDMLAVALVSPRGRNAAEVDLPTALKLADDSLHMTAGGPDQAEASFWLRKALSLSVGTPQMSWTLTQLGTLYAQPSSGPPDYGKARLLWEMAGASGDATALCFLGALYEHGLGVAKAYRQALTYYQRAKTNGGCRDVDAAIARVRN